MSADPFDLSRFVTAQAGVFGSAIKELAAGRKRSHWMWFVFPQLRDLGRSPTALHFGIGSLGEATATFSTQYSALASNRRWRPSRRAPPAIYMAFSAPPTT